MLTNIESTLNNYCFLSELRSLSKGINRMEKKITKEKKIDRRVRKTRRALKEALIEKLKDKPIQEITVREIADEIDINRGTFYQHYRDIYDMLSQIESELFGEFGELLDNSEKHHTHDIMSTFIGFVTLLKENRDLVLVLLGPNGDPAFVDRVKEMVREHVIDAWMRVNSSDVIQYFDYYYEFVVAGCIGLFQKWLATGAKESPEKLAQMVDAILNGGSDMIYKINGLNHV